MEMLEAYGGGRGAYGGGRGGAKGMEDGRRLSTLRLATCKVYRSRAWRALVIFQGVHGHPLSYAHVKNIQLHTSFLGVL
jgi:hypothetical protein